MILNGAGGPAPEDSWNVGGEGLQPRAELQGSAQRMQFEMDQAEAALNSNNVAEARQHLDYAERALESLEKALNL